MDITLNASNLTTTITTETDGHITVRTFVKGMSVDRTELIGMSVGRNHLLAIRYVTAVLAGRVFGPGAILTDAQGQTYVSATQHVMGRHLNAQLKQMGF